MGQNNTSSPISSSTSPSATDTACVHGRGPEKKPYDAVPTPIVLSATYTFANTAELRDHFEGRVDREEYGRYGNPTVRAAEKTLAALEGAGDAALFGSGMAAITTSLFAMLKAGDHVVMTSDCYRRTRQFVEKTLARFGVVSTLVPPGDLDALGSAIVPGKTRVVFTETPTNPYLRVADIPAVVAVAKKHRGVKVLVDATFATPVNLRALSHGADLVLHAGTKYLGGHNDLLAGAVCGDDGLVSAIRDARSVLGGILDPHAAYLLERGMKTLGLRVGRQNETGLRIARFLEAHPGVRQVHYPGLASHPDHALATRLLAGFGGVVTFRVNSDLEGTSRFIDACRLATIAPSLGGVETLIEQPALMSYYELSTEERLALGIPEDLVRLAVGVESAADIEADLDRALRETIP
ncbi:MAG: aminotransferase class I/II-fold pyridoxal phosphate-dependent enzyme [Myxococcales bacterium]|nr:aminotransferase class I/II-fold pyridoxal phosphate-dependent enzyme [Myxococcales bacterium]